MPRIHANWDEVAAGTLIPEGRYPARIDKVEERTSSAGNEYWNVEFTIIDGEYEGRKLWGVFMLSPQALWKLRALAQACGLDLSGERELDSEELVGQEVGIVVTTEEYDGQTRNRVNQFFAL